MRGSGVIVLLVLPALLPAPQATAATLAGTGVQLDRPLDDDLYAAAADMAIASAVAGSAVVAAGAVAITGDVEADALIAAGRVTIAGGIGDDLRVAAGEFVLEGFVTDQATIAAGVVSIQPGSTIGGRTWIAAGTLELDGQLGGDVRIFARRVVISGRIAGDVQVTASEIRVLPGAVIGGNLLWRSEQQPDIAEEARILGDVSGMRGPRAPGRRPGTGSGLFVGIAMGLAALLLWLMVPGLVSRSAAGFASAPVRTLLLGGVGLLVTPVAALILAATIFGWILALVLMSGYLFGLLMAGLLGLLMLAGLVRDRLFGAGTPGKIGGWRSVLLLAALVALIVAAQGLPVLGSLLNLALLLAGFGALTALATGRWAGQDARRSTAEGRESSLS